MSRINSSMKRLIEKNAVAISTVNSKGNPHTIAAGFCKVKKGNLVLTAAYMNETLKNIEKNKNVSVAVWSRNWEKKCEGYEFRGTAKYFTDGEWVDFVKRLKENKGILIKGAIVITVSKIKRLA